MFGNLREVPCSVHGDFLLKVFAKDYGPSRRVTHLYYKGTHCGCKFRAEITDYELYAGLKNSGDMGYINSLPSIPRPTTKKIGEI